MQKSSQLGTTSALSYKIRWHDFCHIIIFFLILFIYWVIGYVMLKINLIHNFLRVLVLRNKKLDNRVWIMFDGNVIQ